MPGQEQKGRTLLLPHFAGQFTAVSLDNFLVLLWSARRQIQLRAADRTSSLFMGTSEKNTLFSVI